MPEPQPNYFGDLLRILSTSELITLHLRCALTNPRLSQVLEDEIIERSLPAIYPTNPEP